MSLPNPEDLRLRSGKALLCYISTLATFVDEVGTVCRWWKLCPPAGLGERHAINQILSWWGIVPQHLLHCEVVIPHDAAPRYGAAVTVTRRHLVKGLHSSCKAPTKTDVSAARKPVAHFEVKSNKWAARFFFNCVRRQFWNLRRQSHAYRKPSSTQKDCCFRQQLTVSNHVSNCVSKVMNPTVKMVIDLAGQQPLPSCLGDHLGGNKGGGEEAEDVGAMAPVQQCVPVEKRRMNIHLITHAEQMPGHLLVLA